MSDAPVILVNHLLEPPAKITGITRYIFSLLEELVSNNSFQYVLATTWPREDLPERLRSVSLTRRFVRSTPLNIATQMAVIPRLMRETKAELEFNCNPIGCIWPFWPRVITVHDLYYDLMPHNFSRRRLLWWHQLFPRAIDASSAIICVSEASRQHLMRLYPQSAGKAIVVHEASALKDGNYEKDAKHNEPGRMPTKPYAVYVGNISPNKNPSIFVEALKILETRRLHISACHVGRDELALLAEAQRRTGLQHTVLSKGTVSDGTLAAIYANAHCLVNTSLDEGFCIPVLEAQSFGVPVVCSDIAVLREVAGNGALFFDPRDPAALAEALATIFTDPSQHAQMADRARQNAYLFSWSHAAAETEAIFRNVLDRRIPSARAR